MADMVKLGKNVKRFAQFLSLEQSFRAPVASVCLLKPQEESSVQNNNSSSRKSSPDSSFGMWKMLKVSGYIRTGDHLHANDRNLNLCLVQKTFMDLFIQVEQLARIWVWVSERETWGPCYMINVVKISLVFLGVRLRVLSHFNASFIESSCRQLLLGLTSAQSPVWDCL